MFSGAPSTLHALATGGSVLEAPRAAGTLLGAPTLVRGAAAHLVVSAWWTAVLVRVLPARSRAVRGFAGAAAGAAIHVLDMEVIGRRIPNIRDLPRLPQLADHLAFGALVGLASTGDEG